jgi:hypothetical protein
VLREALVVILSKLLSVTLLKVRSLIENVFSVIPQHSNYCALNVANQPVYRELAPDVLGILIVKSARVVAFLPVAITQDESTFETYIEPHVKSWGYDRNLLRAFGVL